MARKFRSLIAGAKLFIISFFSLILSSMIVSAYFPSTREISQGIIDTYVDFFEPILQALFGGNDWTGFLLFERLLIYILLLAFIYAVMKKAPVFSKMPGWVVWTVSIIVPLLGIRFLDYEWLFTIIMQYQVLAIALTSVLPFIIYFFFLHGVAEDQSSVRKIGWIFFIIVYLGLWSTADIESHSDIYFWTMIAAFVFLLADGTIHRYYIKQKLKDSNNDSIVQHISKLRNEIREIQDAGMSGTSQGKKAIERRLKDIETWEKRLGKYS